MIRNACGADGLLTTLRLKKKKKNATTFYCWCSIFRIQISFPKTVFFLIIIIYWSKLPLNILDIPFIFCVFLKKNIFFFLEVSI
jgi:hypothetical protein